MGDGVVLAYLTQNFLPLFGGVGLAIIIILILIVLFLSFSKGSPSKKRKNGGKAPSQIESNRDLILYYRETEQYSKLADFCERLLHSGAMKLNAQLQDAKITREEVELNAGIAFCFLKNWSKASEYLEPLLTKLENSWEAPYYLGIVYAETAYPEKAFDLLKQAYRKNPKEIKSLSMMAIILTQVQRFREALALFRKIPSTQMDPRSNYFKAICLENDTNETEALFLYDRVVKTAVGDPVLSRQALRNMGWIHQRRAEYENAISYLLQAIHLAPRNDDDRSELSYSLGLCYADIYDLDNANTYLREAQLISPGKYPDIDKRLAYCASRVTEKELRQYLESQGSHFENICLSLVNKLYPKHKISQIEIASKILEGYIDIFATIERSNWEESVLFRFFKENNQVGEVLVRDFYTYMREKHYGHGVLVSPGIFSNSSHIFTEARSIDLVEKIRLIKLLNTPSSRK